MKRDYTNEDLEYALKKAFMNNKFGTISIDGDLLRSRFVMDGINHAVNNKWIKG